MCPFTYSRKNENFHNDVIQIKTKKCKTLTFSEVKIKTEWNWFHEPQPNDNVAFGTVPDFKSYEQYLLWIIFIIYELN